MKIALITIQRVNNYGAVLQTFACQETLRKHGDVFVLDYRNEFASGSLHIVRWGNGLRSILGTVKDLMRVLPRRRVVRKFNDFLSSRLSLLPDEETDDLVDFTSGSFDVVVAGSDQIWNPKCVSLDGTLDKSYFLESFDNAVRKISYASSMGGYKYSKAEEDLVKRLLSDFDSLSTRERDTSEYLSALLERTVAHVLDPTLLLTEAEWGLHQQSVDEYDLPDEFILVYSIPRLPLLRATVSAVRKKTSLPVVAIDQNVLSMGATEHHLRDVGPQQFLTLFARAKFVVTDSFHGTCFSLIYGKSFFSATAGVHANRIKSLLYSLQRSDRLIADESQLAGLDCSPVDVDWQDRLAELRRHSLAYLSDALGQSEEENA